MQDAIVKTQQCVVAVYGSLDAAQGAVQTLRAAGIQEEAISLVGSLAESQIGELEQSIPYTDDAAHDIARGAGLGGLVGLLAGLAVLSVSGVGLVFFAGALAAGLTGGVVGTFLGGMSGWGLHHNQIEFYRQQVKAGASLVAVHGDPLVVAHAERVLQDQTQPRELHLHAATGDDSPEVDDSPMRVLTTPK